jgi:hypothetical protein
MYFAPKGAGLIVDTRFYKYFAPSGAQSYPHIADQTATKYDPSADADGTDFIERRTLEDEASLFHREIGADPIRLRGSY